MANAVTTTQLGRLDPEIVLGPIPETDIAEPELSAPASSLLRRMLVLLDASGVAVGWATGLLVTGGLTSTARPIDSVPFVASIVVMTAVTLALVAGQGLYLSRVCSIRAVEIGRLSRASVAAAAAGVLVPRLLPLELSVAGAAVSAALAFLLLVLMRGCYRYWLQSGRRDGRFLRPVVVVGTNEESYDLYKLTQQHPEMGYSVIGMVGDDPTTGPFDVPVLGAIEDAPSVCRAAGANGALIAASAMTPRRLNGLVRMLLRDGLHVHLSTGLRGIDHRRLRAQPLAHEPLFYLEPLHLRPWQATVKRAVDIVGAVVGGVIAAPILLLAAVSIKINDRGAVFYRQTRVGRNGVPFRILKLRTMSPDADQRYDGLAATKAGRDGPLIKLTDDPRRTAVGRFLERFSIDELPQLWNVLTGDMSLVGPRPAQAAEVAQFDDALLTRLEVRPGISGLWQVEARDNPSFSAYRRYDLFYLENWSVSLDVAIMLATVQQVLLRGFALVVGHKPEVAGADRSALAPR